MWEFWNFEWEGKRFAQHRSNKFVSIVFLFSFVSQFILQTTRCAANCARFHTSHSCVYHWQLHRSWEQKESVIARPIKFSFLTRTLYQRWHRARGHLCFSRVGAAAKKPVRRSGDTTVSAHSLTAARNGSSTKQRSPTTPDCSWRRSKRKFLLARTETPSPFILLKPHTEAPSVQPVRIPCTHDLYHRVVLSHLAAEKLEPRVLPVYSTELRCLWKVRVYFSAASTTPAYSEHTFLLAGP